ncbi:MAG: proline dehydrogenase family protein [Ignavibacteriaceae bacterium]|nr:proline dehydrogenase family protein [Ignavibacteriaceae bacterium]
MSFFNNLIVSAVQLMPKSVVGFFSKRYIAGEDIEDAVKVTRELNRQGIYSTIDVLGEAVQNREEAIESKNKALEVLDTIVQFKLNANLSIKPTQMGLAIDEDFAYEQVRSLVQKAKEINSFIRIDMEDFPYTDATFRLLRRLKQDYDNLGVVVQAYLIRTYDDIVVLNKIGTNYRLCKGIYIEPASIAYKDKEVIRKNYVKDLELILKNGNYVGIATHDEYLVNEAYRLIKELNIPKNKFEFQMLLGVREDLRNKINNDGYKVRIYVPFGKDWYAYSTRRLKENPQMAGQIFRNLFSLK